MANEDPYSTSDTADVTLVGEVAPKPEGPMEGVPNFYKAIDGFADERAASDNTVPAKSCIHKLIQWFCAMVCCSFDYA